MIARLDSIEDHVAVGPFSSENLEGWSASWMILVRRMMLITQTLLISFIVPRLVKSKRAELSR